MTMTQQATIAPLLKSITVKASAARAFRVFTDEMDTWWPRTHHIGKSPMKRVMLEGKLGGRCYTEQEDNTECEWGSVLAWDPPRRFVMAWQINGEWQFEPDVAKSSEVEVTFTPLGNGTTRVDVEHRGFDKMPSGGDAMRAGVGGDGGWNGLLSLFAAAADKDVG